MAFGLALEGLVSFFQVEKGEFHTEGAEQAEAHRLQC